MKLTWALAMKKCIAVFSVIVLFAGSVLAETYEDPFISLEVPEGFDGPIQGSDGSQAKVVGYAKPYRNGRGNTLLTQQQNIFHLKRRSEFFRA